MISYLAGFSLFLSSFFRSRCNLGLEIVALRQQSGVLNRQHPRSDCVQGIHYFGSCFGDFGLNGRMLSLLSGQKQLLLGIVPVSVCSGVCDRVQRIVAGPKYLLKSDLQSSKWRKKMGLIGSRIGWRYPRG
jgi:hypothetical protein